MSPRFAQGVKRGSNQTIRNPDKYEKYRFVARINRVKVEEQQAFPNGFEVIGFPPHGLLYTKIHTNPFLQNKGLRVLEEPDVGILLSVFVESRHVILKRCASVCPHSSPLNN
jgi:hypothetical protein